MWSNARTAVSNWSIMKRTEVLKGRKITKNKESMIHVVDNSNSLAAAVVGWILWRLCHHQPDSLVADSSGRGSGT